MESAGVELERFSRFPTWRLVGFGLLALFLGDELLVAARTGELRLPPWLGDRGVVVVMAATVMGVVGLGFELARQAFVAAGARLTLPSMPSVGYWPAVGTCRVDGTLAWAPAAGTSFGLSCTELVLSASSRVDAAR